MKLTVQLTLEPSREQRKRTVSSIDGALLKRLPPSLICFTDVVSKKFLTKKGFTLSDKPPVVGEVGGLYYILDGNHRCAFEFWLRGASDIECAIWGKETIDKILMGEIRLLAESDLFRRTIEDPEGVQRAVDAHLAITGQDKPRPGLLVTNG